MSETAEPDCDPGQELLAFRVGNQEFCIDVMSILEIRGWAAASPLPQRDIVCGVTYLCGTALPVIDLAAILGPIPAKPTPRHAIIVAEIGAKAVGLLMEGVTDIFPATADLMLPVPVTSTETAKRAVRGLFPLDGRFIYFIGNDSVLPSLSSGEDQQRTSRSSDGIDRRATPRGGR